MAFLQSRTHLLVKKCCYFHSNLLILYYDQLILVGEKVSDFKLKSRARMVADGYKESCDKQRTG